MAKEISWTPGSLQDRLAIYKYWQERNKSDIYSEKLEIIIIRSVELLSLFPFMGQKTMIKNTYLKVAKTYKIFYRVREDKIEILRVWDTRRDPESLKV